MGVQSRAEVKAITEKSKNILKQTDPTLESQVDSLENNTMQMLTVFENEPSDTAEFNASFVAMAEKLPANVPGMDEKIYLTLAAQQLRKSGFYTSVNAVPTELKIANQNFATIKAGIRGENDQQAYQEFFVKKADAYVLIFIISYRTQEQHGVLRGILESITLP